MAVSCNLLDAFHCHSSVEQLTVVAVGDQTGQLHTTCQQVLACKVIIQNWPESKNVSGTTWDVLMNPDSAPILTLVGKKYKVKEVRVVHDTMMKSEGWRSTCDTSLHWCSHSLSPITEWGVDQHRAIMLVNLSTLKLTYCTHTAHMLHTLTVLTHRSMLNIVIHTAKSECLVGRHRQCGDSLYLS